MQNNRLALDNQWVRIENFQASFSIKKKQPDIKHTQFIKFMNLRD